ncbi:hypothetical protein L7F22_004616, partial [Adiantum nelumboides]|nr:hypothetical protein [Adiantum nelumboides]
FVHLAEVLHPRCHGLEVMAVDLSDVGEQLTGLKLGDVKYAAGGIHHSLALVVVVDEALGAKLGPVHVNVDVIEGAIVWDDEESIGLAGLGGGIAKEDLEDDLDQVGDAGLERLASALKQPIHDRFDSVSMAMK